MSKSDHRAEPGVAKRAGLPKVLGQIEEKFRALHDTMPHGVVFQGADGVIVSVNPAAERILGVTASQVVGEALPIEGLEVVGADGEVLSLGEYPSLVALRTGREVSGVVVGVRSAQGETRWLELTAVPLSRPGERAPWQVYTVFADVTERVRVNEALREREREYRSLAENSPEIIARFDRDFRCTYINRFGASVYDSAPEAIVGRRVSEIGLPLDQAAFWVACLERVFITGEQIATEVHLETRAGGRHLSALLMPELDDRGSVVTVLTIMRDVTALHHAERAMRASEARFRAAAESMPGALLIYDRDGRITFANSEAGQLAGRPGERLLGRYDDEVYPAGIIAQCRPAMERAIAERAPRRVEVSSDDGAGGQVVRVVTYVPVLDAEGRVWQLLSVSHDVTDERRAVAQLREREQMLREADMRKDEFLAMLSHELRNPLAPIRNGIYIIAHTPPGSAEAARATRVVERQTQHLSRLVDDLLDVTRISRGKIELRRELFDASDLAQKVCDDHRATFEVKGLSLSFEPSPQPLRVEADPTRIAQVIGNLLSNAAKFTPRGGRATVTARAPGGRVEIVVRDDGIGIDPSQIDRMFEPFAQGERTLARTQGGLGLGLALVKGLAELHGGGVSAESRGPGTGSEFVVWLPQAPVETAERPRETAPASERRPALTTEARG